MAYTKTNWVNGTTPLNDTNMNKIENALENLDTNISKSTDEYSSTRTYSIGELVIYNNKLYKANQDITTAEAFNSSHWTEVTLLSDVNEIKSVVNNNADNLNKLNTATSSADGLMSKTDKSKLDNIFNSIYPVGSIYMSVNNTNPATLFGGTWTQIKGRFLLGTGSLENNNNGHFGQVTAGDVDAPVGEKGGEAWHRLTINEMPKHKHNSKVRMNWYDGTAYGPLFNQGNSSNVGVDRETTYTDEVGGDNSHNNIPPYFAVFIWQRTA